MGPAAVVDPAAAEQAATVGPLTASFTPGGRPSQIGGTTVTRGSGGLKGMGGFRPVIALPDGGIVDAGVSEGGPDGRLPDGGLVVQAADGNPGDAAYELAIP